jgi:predicted secreted protein
MTQGRCPQPHRRVAGATAWLKLKLTLTLTLTLPLTSLLLAGCSLFGKPASIADSKPPVARMELIRDAGKKVLVVGTEDNGARIELTREQGLTVRLANPSASLLEWSLVDGPGNTLTTQAPKFERDPRSAAAGEAEGHTVWLMRPVAPGTVTLRFEFRRPRNTAPALQVVTYIVTVQ